MRETIRCHLKPVRTRQRWQTALRAAAVGLLIGSCLALGLAVARLFGAELSRSTTLLFPIAGLAAGLLTGLAWKRNWKAAASAVDSHYRLKDRAATALAFVEDPKPTIFHRLQIADAVEHLDRVDAGRAAPLRFPRILSCAVAAVAAVAVLVLIPNGVHQAEAKMTAPLPEIVAEAESLEESLIEHLDELAEQQAREELRELIEELEELVGEMKLPGVGHRDALAKLSEMEAAIAKALAEYNLEATDARLQELAEAIAPADALKDASEALREGKYDKAAEKLEDLDASKITSKEAQTIAEQLRELAKEMEDAGQGQLGEATSELSEGLELEDEVQCELGAGKLAGVCREQALRKQIGNSLRSQLSELAASKGRCRTNNNGGTNVAKSQSPSETWGRAPSNKPLGQRTDPLAAKRERQDVTGTHGEGPSEIEISRSAGQRQQASRSYREVYQEYRKMSEAVLESEPLPLGHRETIRRYFELIHPQNASSSSHGS